MDRSKTPLNWLLGGQESAQIRPANGVLLPQQHVEEDSESDNSTIRNFRPSPSVAGSIRSTTSHEWGDTSFWSEDWPAETWYDAPETAADIRHSIAPVNKMVRFEGRLFQTGQEEKDQDEVLDSKDFLSKFVEGWRDNVPVSEKVDMNKKNVDKYIGCSIDTNTGKYLEKVVQPVSKRDMKEYKKSKPAMRTHRDVWSSRVRAAQYMQKLKNMPKPKDTHTPPEGYVQTEYEKPAVKDNECVLRPATAEDMPGVAAIYNHEVFNSLRAWDTEKVPVSDFVGLLNDLQKTDLPFIVAAQRLAVDLEDALGEPEKILGFGFLEKLDGGFGSGKHVGDMSCRLSLYVHNEHRKKNIGSAIIDRILICMSRTHPGSAVDHKWESDGHHPYNDAENSRMVRFLPNRIIVEGLFAGKKDEEYEWFDKIMASFRFNEAGHIDGAYSTRRGMRSQCFDKFTWVYMAQIQPEPHSGDQNKDAEVIEGAEEQEQVQEDEDEE